MSKTAILLDSVLQHNTGNAEEMNSMAEELTSQAANLNSSIFFLIPPIGQ